MLPADSEVMAQYATQYPAQQGWVKRSVIRAHCKQCLAVEMNGTMTGWDCLVCECKLYPFMPWRGRELPNRLKPKV